MKRFLLTGHVDHGKSTLGGQLLYQCGALDEREVQKIFQQAKQDKMYAFRWARLLDINQEEQERGVTIECNEIEFVYQNNKYKLIDTPGHKLYIRHLIEAIYRNSHDANSDGGNVVGVIVLSAILGDTEASISSGQVKEDILLLRAVGIDSIVVAVNKLDKFTTCAKTREAFEAAKASILPILKIARFKHVLYAACSGLDGNGIISCNTMLTEIPSLVDSINTLSATSTQNILNEPARISVKSTLVTADIFVLNCPIFCPGYTGIIHTTSGESSFTVEKVCKISSDKLISKKSLPFIKTGERGTITLTVDENISFNNRDRIILRSNDSTIAYGIITPN